MDKSTASSLVTYLNRQSSRFSATTIEFTERTWVILRDSMAPHTAPCEEPILDVRNYLDRSDRRCPLSAELRSLLEIWLQASGEEKTVRWPSNPSVPCFPSTTAGRDSDSQSLDTGT